MLDGPIPAECSGRAEAHAFPGHADPEARLSGDDIKCFVNQFVPKLMVSVDRVPAYRPDCPESRFDFGLYLVEQGLPEVVRSLARSRNLARGAIMLMAAFVQGSGLAIWLLHEDAIKDTEDDDHRLGVVLSEQPKQTFQAVGLILQEISGRIASRDVRNRAELHDKPSDREVHEELICHRIYLPRAEAFTIVDVSGQIVTMFGQWLAADRSLASRSSLPIQGND